MPNIVLVTGGFDPIHSGHISLFKQAKKLGDRLVVGINSDDWLTRKKGRPFMSFHERASIIKELECVDDVIAFNDNDNTACAAIFQLLSTTSSKWKIIFANGGDRTNTTIPENTCFGDHPSVEFAFGVGGEDKKNSSSWLLSNWKKPTTQREWGNYTILDNGTGWQTKKLEFEVGKSLSNQRHFKRSEHWHIVEGTIHMCLVFPNGDTQNKLYYSGDSIDIPMNTWHKAYNAGDTIAKVVEVWLGNELTEDDIERKD